MTLESNVEDKLSIKNDLLVQFDTYRKSQSKVTIIIGNFADICEDLELLMAARTANLGLYLAFHLTTVVFPFIQSRALVARSAR
ncbi:uncharacterized protein CCR75_002122 [Bremia lactucae]|uniref:Uncharacterized protein n=1 Tax=Bremia lactucae TaxID=4779 RepID=A0A976FDR6_BRELC|nr:hypothetical protein CCR75_002122 [Bremia lactucae]